MRKVLALLFISSSLYLAAQEGDPIVTDRPTQSAAASVVLKKSFLGEVGYIVDLGYNGLLRYGLSDKVELRLSYLEDIGSASIGTKIHMATEEESFANMSVIGQITLDSSKPRGWIYEIRMNFQNTLSDRLSLGYNLGGNLVGDNFTFLYTAVLSYAIDDKWCVFGEPYANFDADYFGQRFDAGVIYLCRNNLQFDVSLDVLMFRNHKETLIGFGAAFGF